MLFEQGSNRFSLLAVVVSLGAVTPGCGGGTTDGEGSNGAAAEGDDESEGTEDDDANEGDDSADVAPRVPLDSDTAEETVQERLSNTLDAFADTAEMIESKDMMSDGMTSMMDPLGECGGIGTVELDVGVGVNDLDEALRELSDVLQTEVFRDDLVESDDGQTVVYWLDPSKVCDETDLECQEELTEHPVRFSVTSHEDDSLRIELLVGEERDNPATLVLTDDSFGVTADLGELLSVLRDIADPEQLDSLPDTLDGQIQGALVRTSEQSFSLEFSILETITFSEGVGEDGESITVSLATAPQALRVGLDGEANTVSFALDVKELDVSVPGSALCGDSSDCDEQERQGNFNAHLGGLSVATTLQDGASVISISNIGLGDDTSYAHLNDAPLVEVDINPDDGRRFDMQVQDVEGGVMVSFEPKLDFKVATTLLNLSEGLRMDLPEWLYDEIFEVTLGGDARGSIFVADDCSEASQILEVTEGTLTLSASSLLTPVVVDAGMCLFAADAPDDGDAAESSDEVAHPFDSLVAGVCE